VEEVLVPRLREFAPEVPVTFVPVKTRSNRVEGVLVPRLRELAPEVLSLLALLVQKYKY
jgi:hypothetical protein